MKVIGKVATITAIIRPTTTGTNLNLAWLPEREASPYKPTEPQWLSCDYCTTSGTQQAEARITASGIVSVSTPVSNVDLKISGAWIID